MNASSNTLNPQKFSNREKTLSGEARGYVPFERLKTLWFNTGTLCNLSCENCYIESSPTNDALEYLKHEELVEFLEQVKALDEPTEEIGFTGGEPFMNPEMNRMIQTCLERGYRVLILTNAMRPMQRRSVAEELDALRAEFGDRLTLRVSLDHYTSILHETERGIGTWAPTIKGVDWLISRGLQTHIAGRTCWGESLEEARRGYEMLFAEQKWPIDAYDPTHLVLFPEMGTRVDLPEITQSCWGVLGKSPSEMMCSDSRMVIKRKGADQPSVVACTLLPYSEDFDYGPRLETARQGTYLNHPHCARFCVLGGASCSS
jgi:uncharacterized Fe-S cluster-containing radical SAM superfamily protein